MRGIAEEAKQYGELVIIGQGTLAQGQDFDKTHGKGMRALVDTKRNAYNLLSLVRSISARRAALGTLRGLDAARRGFVQGRTQGDAHQHGGTLVVARGGRPTYFHKSDYAGDHPPIEDVLQALKLAAKQ